jgi:PKD domain
LLVIGLCFFNLNLILIISHVFIVIINPSAGLFMKFGKLTLLLAFAVFLFVAANAEWVNTTHAQVIPGIQSQTVPEQGLTNSNAATPFSLPSIKLDNNTNIAKAKIGPVTVAGADQIVKEGSTVTLNGSESRDPNGVILSYSWRQIPTSHFITLSGADTPVWSFNAPRVSADTTLTFELTVTDSNGSTDKNTVNVLVKHIFSTSNQSANQLANENTANFANTTTLSTANQQIGDTAPTDNPPIAGIIPQQTP